MPTQRTGNFASVLVIGPPGARGTLWPRTARCGFETNAQSLKRRKGEVRCADLPRPLVHPARQNRLGAVWGRPRSCGVPKAGFCQVVVELARSLLFARGSVRHRLNAPALRVVESWRLNR